MIDIAIDYETYFSDDYSLSKLTTQEYILDERFEVILLAVKVADQPRLVLEPHEIKPWLQQWDWTQVRLAAHNMQFDGAILKWHYGIVPGLYEDTMAMGQAMLGHVIGSASLKSLNEHYGRSKDSGALMNMKGLGYEAAKAHPEWKRYTEYAGQDVDDCRFLLKKFRQQMPPRYRVAVDVLMRMYIESKIVLDPETLEENLAKAAAERERLLAAAGMTSPTQLRSAAQFAGLLEGLGINVPKKISPATGEETYAFAKKDMEFVELLNHERPEVRMLVEARFNAASSLEETRTKRFQSLAALRGGFGVPLMFSGAHTHRFSGRDKLNLQNLPRKSLLRHAIRAPKGYVFVVLDASQIEARILAWLAGCLPLLQAFARHEDVYSLFASVVFGRPISKRENPGERFVGKTSVLGLGFQTGADTLWRTLVLGAQDLGLDIQIPRELAAEAVTSYRQTYPEIPQLWKRADTFIRAMVNGVRQEEGPFTTDYQLPRAPGWVIPGGMPVRYPSLGLRQDEETGRFSPSYYRHRYKTYTSLYGGKLVENWVQHLAFTVIVNAMNIMRLHNSEWLCVLQVHDELAYLVPVDEAEEAKKILYNSMVRQPEWAGLGPLKMPLPLEAEGDINEVYGLCK
jgi:DNA polymerase I-like protein with 3'-5' exonuclease and polymerase domains